MLLVQNNNGSSNPDLNNKKQLEEIQRSHANDKVFYENALQKSQEYMEELQLKAKNFEDIAEDEKEKNQELEAAILKKKKENDALKKKIETLEWELRQQERKL